MNAATPTPPIHLAVPLADGFGWGVCGRQLAIGLARHGGLALAPLDGPVSETVDDPLVRRALAVCEVDPGSFGERVHGAVLQAVADESLLPFGRPLAGDLTVGYTFFEKLPPPGVAETARRWDVVAAGSTWCAEHLERIGVRRVETVLQGVDRRLFHPVAGGKRLFGDRFVVFSGGKLELRKGQDLVIRAFAVLAERHPDVLLVAAWYNPWPRLVAGLGAAPGFTLKARSGSWEELVAGLLADNGVDPARAVVVPRLPHSAVAAVYHESDVGLFPNRCEGGTNLVLMEYMACGKPAIVAHNSGHRDVATADNALLVERMSPLDVRREGELVARWSEPDFEEIVERLEWAYRNRDGLARYGERAGRDMERFTWQATADAFHRLLTAP
jgi:glycosyltransferase involved in cell wall biosynthesis